MKRINQESSTSLNESAFESLKPLYGTKGNPPYYDPNDLHVHIWKKGKLGLEDNPKIRTYAKGKLTVKDCVYCKICHLTKDLFQSTVSSNMDIIDDILMPPLCTQNTDYKIIENNEIHVPFVITKAIQKETKAPNDISSFQNLFHKNEGILDDYVEVVDRD